jgi:hypothetical protein
MNNSLGPTRSPDILTSADVRVELFVDDEKVTPELRKHMEYKLAKAVADRAMLNLEIQLLEIALGIHANGKVQG